MITQRPYIKSENPVSLGSSFCTSERSSSSSLSSVTGVTEMPMKMEERLNELESNAVKALLSLGEAFVSQSPYRAAAATLTKKLPESGAYIRPLQPVQQHQIQNQTTRSVIVKAEPMLPTHEDVRNAIPHPSLQHQQRCTPVTSAPPTSGPAHGNQYVHARELGPSTNGLSFNNQQSTIRLVSSNAPGTPTNHNTCSTTMASPVSIQPVVSAVSSSSPVISTIFYQIPASAASATNGSNGTVVSPSFTIFPAPNGRTVIPLPMVTTSSTSLVKIEPSSVGAQSNTGTPLNWSNIQLLKVPRSSVENGNGLATFSALAPIVANAVAPAKRLPSPGKVEGKSVLPATPMADGKSPTKSRARRRSQSTSKSRNSRVSSSCSSDFMICPSVEGLPNIVVDGYEVSREIWAKAFLQNDIIHAAGTLFNALFSSEEIKNCTLNGRNGTRQLCPEKRLAIFKIVAWMKNKCQDPYSFNKSPEESKILNREEQMMIEKKVFVERRYQTSRKIRDLPSAPQPPISLSTVSSSVVTSVSPATPSKSPLSSTNAKCNQKSSSMPSVPLPAIITQRRDSGSFSSICNSTGDDKGIPKIALIQSSEIIANYFQSTDPLPLSTTKPSLISSIPHDGPPPLKMQKVG